MREHDTSAPTPDEPEGGWQQAPTLHDSEILSVVLCRYTGQQPILTGDRVGLCDARLYSQHPDVECMTLYHQQEALQGGRIHYDMPATEVTLSLAGTDPTYINPVR